MKKLTPEEALKLALEGIPPSRGALRFIGNRYHLERIELSSRATKTKIYIRRYMT